MGFFSWLSENIATLLIVAALIATVALIVRKLVRDKKAGRSSCGCGCAGCPMSGACHKQPDPGDGNDE